MNNQIRLTKKQDAAYLIVRAFADRIKDDCKAFTVAEQSEYRDLSSRSAEVGICFTCAINGYVQLLCPLEPGDYYNHAGRACPYCEEFFPMPEHDPEYSDGVYEYSDADPGL